MNDGEHTLKLGAGESIVVLEGELELGELKANSYESFISLGDQDINIKVIHPSTFILTK